MKQENVFRPLFNIYTCVVVWGFACIYLIPIYFDVKEAQRAFYKAEHRLEKEREDFEIQQRVLMKYFWGECPKETFRLIRD